MSKEQNSTDIFASIFSPASAGGTTPSVSPDGLTTSPSGPARARANRSRKQASSAEKPTNATSGPTCADSSPSAAQGSSSASKSPRSLGESGSTGEKICNVCETQKPLSEFYRSKTSSGGYRQPCRTCSREQEKARKAVIPKAELSAKYKVWRKSNRAAALLTLARYRAKQKGREFTLVEKDIQNAIMWGRCALTGIPFNLENGKTWDSPSIDRIDCSKGYTPDNVRMVLYCVNVMANIWGPEKITEIAEAIRQKRARVEASAALQKRLESSLRSALDASASPECALTWKNWDMPSGPPICAQRASVRRTSASDSSGAQSSWATPSATTWGGTADAHLERKRRARAEGKSMGLVVSCLDQQAQLAPWATSTSRDHKDGGSDLTNTPINALLGRQGRLAPWPTTATLQLETPEKKVAREANSGLNLAVAATYAGVDLSSSSAPTAAPAGFRLNPWFSNWLMGFPSEWVQTATRALPTRSRKSRSPAASPSSGGSVTPSFPSLPPSSSAPSAKPPPMPESGYTLSDIATERMPLRASSLYYLNCTLRFYLMLQQEREVGEAANTGTLIHEGIDTWVKGSSLAAASEAMLARQAKFRRDGETQGDLEAAQRWLTQYTEDPRNAPLGHWPVDRRYGRVMHSEARCFLRLPCAEFDPTGEDVIIAGTLDQIRESPADGSLWLWDVKSSKIRTGASTHTLMLDHLYQTICYAAAAEQMLGKPVGLGGIISLRGYGARREEAKDVFISAPVELTTHKQLVLDRIVEQIALMRSGHLTASIGDHCTRCYIAQGPADCIPQLARLSGT